MFPIAKKDNARKTDKHTDKILMSRTSTVLIVILCHARGSGAHRVRSTFRRPGLVVDSSGTSSSWNTFSTVARTSSSFHARRDLPHPVITSSGSVAPPLTRSTAASSSHQRTAASAAPLQNSCSASRPERTAMLFLLDWLQPKPRSTCAAHYTKLFTTTCSKTKRQHNTTMVNTMSNSLIVTAS